MWRSLGERIRSMRWEIGLALVLCVVSFAYLFMLNVGATPAFNAQKRELPVYSVETDEKVVCLTFDTAYGEDKLDGIMELLDKYDAKCTFFVTGDWAKRYPHRVKQIAEHGHEVATHSMTHPHMAGMDETSVEKEIVSAVDAIEEACGQRTKVFRVPYGEYDDTVVRTSRKLGFQIVQWDVDSIDWKGTSVEFIDQRIRDNIQPGSIILFHTYADQILQALPVNLETIKSLGYRFAKLTDTVLYENYTIDHTGRQFPAETSEEASSSACVQ